MKSSTAAARCRRRFLRFFPGGFSDDTYLDWERNYKAEPAREWQSLLSRERFELMLDTGRFREIANQALRIESQQRRIATLHRAAIHAHTAWTFVVGGR